MRRSPERAARDAREAPRVLLVTDSRRLAPAASSTLRIEQLIAQARAAFAAGVDAIHLREPDLDGQALFKAASAIAPLGRLIVGDRIDVALAAGAAGVHLRGDGPASARARRLIGEGLSLSRAVHSVDEARREGADLALDWIVAGNAFETSSKPGKRPLGPEGLAVVVAASRLPVIAIGGITASNAGAVRRAGAWGIAGIGLFTPSIAADFIDSLRSPSLE